MKFLNSYAFVQFIAVWVLSLSPLLAAAQPSTKPSTVSLLVVGDMMLAGAPGKAMQQGRDPFGGFSKLFKDSDIRIGNLECVVATKGSEEPDKPNTFRAHPRSLKYLRKYFDAVGLANNHSGDFGPEASGPKSPEWLFAKPTASKYLRRYFKLRGWALKVLGLSGSSEPLVATTHSKFPMRMSLSLNNLENPPNGSRPCCMALPGAPASIMSPTTKSETVEGFVDGCAAASRGDRDNTQTAINWTKA